MSESTKSDYQGLVLWGATGNVGTRLVKDITEKDYPEGANYGNEEPIPHEHPSKVVCVVDSTRFYIQACGIPVEDLRGDLDKDGRERKVKNILLEKGTEYSDPQQVMNAVRAATTNVIADEDIIHVDLTDGSELKPVYDDVLHNTNSGMVAINKGVLANATLEEFKKYVVNGKLEFKSTVGAGANAVDVCLDSVELGNPVTEIMATLSGTCGKLSNMLNSQEFRDGKIEFSDIAKSLYPDDTEPHPHTDFSGEDVKKKITILALAAGYDVSMKTIKVENPIVPDSYLERFPTKNDAIPYLESLGELDVSMREKAEAAHNEGKVLVYLAKMKIENEEPVLTVGFEALDPTGEATCEEGVSDEEYEVACQKAQKEADIASAKNNIIFITDSVEEQSMQKPGSGGEVTSKAARRGILSQIPRGQKRMKYEFSDVA